MTEKDLDLVVTNLKSCLDTKHKIHSLDEETVQKMEPETTKVKNINELLEIEEALAIEKQNFNEYFDHVKSIISDFNLDETSLIRMKLNTHLVAEFDMNKQDFMSSIDHFLSSDLSSSEQFVYFSKILIRNQAYLFESDMNLFREFDLDLDYLNNLDLLSKCVKLLLGYLNTFDYKKLKVDDETLKEKLAQFLKQAYAYKPVLFKLLVQLTSPDSLNKNLKKFASSNNDLLSVFESCYQEDSSSLDNLTPNEEEFLKLYSTNNKNYASLNVDQLLEVYTFSLSVKDQLILKRLHELDSNLNCLHYNSKLTEFISLRMNQDTSMISTSILNYPINRKLDDLSVQLDKEVTLDTIVLDELSLVNAKIFDPIYVLPNLYHLLDYENNVDVVQFVQSKCLSYLLASLSSECKHLRSLSYACVYRFVAHLEKNKSYFKNIIVHLISLLKNSIKIENLKLPTVISVFLAEAVMVVIEPGTNLYKPIVSFLILKPTLDFTNVPEFYKLFNSSSLQYKLERKWMLNILVTSCRTSLDYRLFEKRFVYRQLMSIYDSKMSDLDTKLSILNLIYRTCQCKFALIDLIKRHYLLIWLTSVLENCLTKSNQQTEINIFYKLIQIYVLIWHQLGSSRTVNNEVHTPPLAFLNQMFILMKLLLVKLVDHHSKINELKYEFKSDETKSLNLGRIVIRNFFKVKRELTHSLKSFNLNLVKLEESDNLDNEFKCLSKKECTFEDVQEKISARKRVCSIDLNTTTNNNKKIRTF